MGVLGSTCFFERSMCKTPAKQRKQKTQNIASSLMAAKIRKQMFQLGDPRRNQNLKNRSSGSRSSSSTIFVGIDSSKTKVRKQVFPLDDPRKNRNVHTEWCYLIWIVTAENFREFDPSLKLAAWLIDVASVMVHSFEDGVLVVSIGLLISRL